MYLIPYVPHDQSPSGIVSNGESMQIMIIHILTVVQKLTDVDNVTDRQTDEEDEM